MTAIINGTEQIFHRRLFGWITILGVSSDILLQLLKIRDFTFIDKIMKMSDFFFILQ
jgi:hypothetical protein